MPHPTIKILTEGYPSVMRYGAISSCKFSLKMVVLDLAFDYAEKLFLFVCFILFLIFKM